MSKGTQNNISKRDINAAKLVFIRNFWGEGDTFVDKMIAMQGADCVIKLQFPAILKAIKDGPTPQQIRSYRSQEDIDSIIRKAENY